MRCGIGHRCGLDLSLLWYRPGRPVATAPTGLLAWESPYAMGVAKKKKKKKKGSCEIYKIKNKLQNEIYLIFYFTKKKKKSPWVYAINSQMDQSIAKKSSCRIICIQ